MFARYNISDVKRKRKALELAQGWRDSQATQVQESNVVAMKR
jgi:hypothetical protein